jgi:hypothetical protein
MPAPNEHSWSEAQRISCALSQRRCTRCGTLESVKIVQHIYGPWETLQDGRNVRTCQECSNREFGS